MSTASRFFMPVLRFAVCGQGVELAGDTHAGRLDPALAASGATDSCFMSRAAMSTHGCPFPWGTPTIVRGPDVVIELPAAAAVRSENPGPAVRIVRWEMEPDTGKRIAELPWQQGHDNWFFLSLRSRRDRDHGAVSASNTEAPRSHPGCGCGRRRITDLGIFLRYRPEMPVALDIVDYVQHLPSVARSHGVPITALPDGFRFCQCSAESIPYPNGYFDVVLSWGSVEHVKGGYEACARRGLARLEAGRALLRQPRSVLRPVRQSPRRILHRSRITTSEWMSRHCAQARPELRAPAHRPLRLGRAELGVLALLSGAQPIRVGSFESELKSYGTAPCVPHSGRRHGWNTTTGCRTSASSICPCWMHSSCSKSLCRAGSKQALAAARIDHWSGTAFRAIACS